MPKGISRVLRTLHNSQEHDSCPVCQATLDQLRAENERLLEALRPFASDLLHLERGQDLPDNASIGLWLHVPDAAPPRDVGLGYLDLGDFRAANHLLASAMNHKQPEVSYGPS